MAQMVKIRPSNAGDQGLIPGLGTSLGEESGNPLQYSFLEEPMDRGAWWATVLGLQRVGHDWVTQRIRLFTEALGRQKIGKQSKCWLLVGTTHSLRGIPRSHPKAAFALEHPAKDSLWLTVLVSCGHCNTGSKIWWLKRTEIYYLTVLGISRPKSVTVWRDQGLSRALLLLEAPRGESVSLPLPTSRGCPYLFFKFLIGKLCTVCSVRVCSTTTQISSMYTQTCQFHSSRSSQSPELISLCYTAPSHKLSIISNFFFFYS